jgi:hypothetical protein
MTQDLAVAKFPSTSKTKMSAMFPNAQDATPYRTAISKMGHPQTNNACTTDIISGMVKQCRSKVTGIGFYWIKEQVIQGEDFVHWRGGTDNLTNYFTNHHSPPHTTILCGIPTFSHSNIPYKCSKKGVLMSTSGFIFLDITSGYPTHIFELLVQQQFSQRLKSHSQHNSTIN